MKAIDNSGLQTISNIIVGRIKTNSIYCFGERKLTHESQNPFQELVSTKKEHTHLYLLVFTDEYINNAVADISDSIKNRTDGLYTATLLFCKVKSGTSLGKHQSYFCHQVMMKGCQVYEPENRPFTISFEEIPKLKLKYISSYWKNRSIIAETFLNNQNQIDYGATGFVQDSMMHIAVEQICLGLINVFLGYHPDHFSLPYLFDLCEIFTPLTSEIFPRNTPEDIELLELLKTNPSSLRWMNVKGNSLINTELLGKRCNLFHARACELIEAELERIENLYKKELQKN